MSKFAVGEIAVVLNTVPKFAGMEVTVLQVEDASDYTNTCHGNLYITSAHPEFLFCDCALRKKRPPQDWRRLCNLDDVPQRAEELA